MTEIIDNKKSIGRGFVIWLSLQRQEKCTICEIRWKKNDEKIYVDEWKIINHLKKKRAEFIRNISTLFPILTFLRF